MRFRRVCHVADTNRISLRDALRAHRGDKVGLWAHNGRCSILGRTVVLVLCRKSGTTAGLFVSSSDDESLPRVRTFAEKTAFSTTGRGLLMKWNVEEYPPLIRSIARRIKQQRGTAPKMNAIAFCWCEPPSAGSFVKKLDRGEVEIFQRESNPRIRLVDG